MPEVAPKKRRRWVVIDPTNEASWVEIPMDAPHEKVKEVLFKHARREAQ